MSCYAVKYGLHLLDTSCARQTVIALSFGEAEYYALTRGASAGLLVKGVYGEIGKEVADDLPLLHQQRKASHQEKVSEK